MQEHVLSIETFQSEYNYSMGHIAHLSHLYQYLKISPLHVHFLVAITKQIHATCKGCRCLRAPQSCICDLSVVIPTVLEIMGHFFFKRDVCGTTRMAMTIYHQMFPYRRNKSVYVLLVRISNVFKILKHIPFKGDRGIPYNYDQGTSKCSLTRETRIYMVYGWDLNSFQFIRTPPV
jgi:hypothetical protein